MKKAIEGIKEFIIEVFTDKYFRWYLIGLLILMLGGLLSSHWIAYFGGMFQGGIVGLVCNERNKLEKEVEELKKD